MVRVIFEAENLEVFDAVNGAEGVQKAQEVKPGLIILDLSMPVMNGLDAARELKVLMPHGPLVNVHKQRWRDSGEGGSLGGHCCGHFQI
jgi:CheY-like chemotaxis protein